MSFKMEAFKTFFFFTVFSALSKTGPNTHTCTSDIYEFLFGAFKYKRSKDFVMWKRVKLVFRNLSVRFSNPVYQTTKFWTLPNSKHL